MKYCPACQRAVFGFFLILSLFLPPAGGVSAAELKITSDTMVRSYERDTSIKTDVLVLPVYEFLQVDYGALSDRGLAFHANGWGRTDTGDRDFFTDDETGELLYGYLEYTTEKNDLSARVGRQYVFEGPAAESIDGVRVQGTLGSLPIGFSAFAGLPVALNEEKGTSGDFARGATVNYTWKDFNRVGLSYKQVTNDSTRAEELAGFDLFMLLPLDVDLSAKSTRNLVTDDWSEHFVEARFKQLSVDFRPYLQQFNYEDYFSTTINSANPFRYLAGTGEKMTIFGTDATRLTDGGWDLGGKVKYYDYSNAGGNSLYIALLATWHGDEMTQAGGEIGDMDGDRPQDDYFMYRFFGYWDAMPVGKIPGFISGDLVFVDYNQPIQNEDTSLFASIGAGWRFMDNALELKVSGDYSSDPYFDSDVKGMVVVTYKLRKESK